MHPKLKKKHVYYFQAIQTALLYKKNVFEMFRYNFSMFLDLQGSFGQNKDQSLDITDFGNMVLDIARKASYGC